jgi:hypothetical protein
VTRAMSPTLSSYLSQHKFFRQSIGAFHIAHTYEVISSIKLSGSCFLESCEPLYPGTGEVASKAAFGSIALL